MSNLKMPTMTCTNLQKIVGNRDTKKIAYATVARKIWNDPEAEYNYLIEHHGNVIAQIGLDAIWLSNGGWNSATTANRLRHIARDNGLPFSIGIKNYDMGLYRIVHNTHDYLASFSHHDFLFRRTNSSWIIER